MERVLDTKDISHYYNILEQKALFKKSKSDKKKKVLSDGLKQLLFALTKSSPFTITKIKNS